MTQERRTTSGKSPMENQPFKTQMNVASTDLTRSQRHIRDFMSKEETEEAKAVRGVALTKVSALNFKIIEVNDF